MNNSIHRSIGLERCPYLGLHDDSSTALAYPSAWNYCYRAAPPASILVSHQVETCLCPAYAECNVYAANKWGPLPTALRGKPAGGAPGHGRLRKLGLAVLLAALVALVILVLFPEQVASYESGLEALFSHSSSNLQGSGNSPQQPALAPSGVEGQTPPVMANTERPATARPSLVAAEDRTGATVPDSSATLAVTGTPPGTCGHTLDVPFGEDAAFVLHRAVSGENLTLYAEQYQTSTDAILAVNYHLPMPVWEGWIIVLPLGTIGSADIPPFETYQALGTSISLAELAEQLNTDPQALYKYNGFQGVCRTFSGWLLIPRKPPVP